MKYVIKDDKLRKARYISFSFFFISFIHEICHWPLTHKIYVYNTRKTIIIAWFIVNIKTSCNISSWLTEDRHTF